MKTQLQDIQSHVLETRKDLDVRKHFDTEVYRWFNAIKTDLSQIELIAAIKNKGIFPIYITQYNLDLEDHIDAQEALKDRIRFLENELHILNNVSSNPVSQVTQVTQMTQVEWVIELYKILRMNIRTRVINLHLQI